MKSKYLIIIVVCLIISSCNFFSKKTGGKTVARVYDDYLYQSDLKNVLPNNYTKEDSIFIVKNYIQDWILQNLLAHKAEEYLPEDKKNFEQRLEDYRNSLIIYEYQKEFIEQKLDTVVKAEEIDDYYKKYSSDFLLKDNIVKASYIKVKKDVPKVYNFWFLYRANDSRSWKELKKLCTQYAESYSITAEEWIHLDNHLKQLPTKVTDQESFLKKKFLETSDNDYYYFSKIYEYKLKGEISPLDLIRNDIRNIILNKRKLNLTKKMEKDLYDNAYNRNNFEIY